MEPLIPIVIVLAVGLIIAAVVYSSLQAKKRREDLARIAAGMNLRFDADDPFDIANRYAQIGLLSAGHNRSAFNVLHGARGPYQIKAFDYLYYTTETSTDAQGHVTTREESHYQSAVLFDLGVALHPLFIRPENFFDKIAAAMGFDDIDFESAEFSRKFFVKSSDKKFAYGVITPQMMEYLLEDPKWSLEIQGASILATRGSTLPPEEFRQAVTWVDGFLKRIPPYIWEQFRGK
jgi:Protein of unknown function (DUF3137)